MSRQVRPRARFVVLGVALVSIAAACGAGDSSEPASANASGTEATLIIDRLFEVFNAEDAEGTANVFGDDVAFTLESGRDVVGADAATFWEQYFGTETFERVTDAFHASDGLIYFHGEVVRSGLIGIYVFDVEMDGERLVRIGAQPRNPEEAVAQLTIDDLYEAFNEQDMDRLTEALEGVTYTPASGGQFTGAAAAEHWADAFGSDVTRTTEVFAIGDDALEFRTEYRERDSGRSTVYTTEVEMSNRRVTGITERTPQN